MLFNVFRVCYGYFSGQFVRLPLNLTLSSLFATFFLCASLQFILHSTFQILLMVNVILLADSVGNCFVAHVSCISVLRFCCWSQTLGSVKKTEIRLIKRTKISTFYNHQLMYKVFNWINIYIYIRVV